MTELNEVLLAPLGEPITAEQLEKLSSTAYYAEGRNSLLYRALLELQRRRLLHHAMEGAGASPRRPIPQKPRAQEEV